MSFFCTTCLLFASIFYTNVPYLEMREKPTSQSEVESGSYYSEEVEKLSSQENMTSDGWIQIRTKTDQCLGWVQRDAIYERTDKYPLHQTLSITRAAAHIYDREDTVFGPIMTLPFGSRLEYIDQDAPIKLKERWIKVTLIDGKEAYVQRGDVTFNLEKLNIDKMITLSHQFLNLPYTWGGRSSFGYDCSGFTQMLYSQMGISLPRNSGQQMRSPLFHSISIKQLSPGDLVFFGRDQNRIGHVALYIGKNKIIHPTVRELKPYIRISSLSDPEWDGEITQEEGKAFPYRTARSLNNRAAFLK